MTEHKINSVVFWIKVGEHTAIIELITTILPLIFLLYNTVTTIRGIFELGRYTPMAYTEIAFHGNPTLLQIMPLLTLIPYWIAYLVAVTMILHFKSYIRLGIVKAMLWNKRTKINELRAYDNKTEARTKDLVNMVTKNGFELENPT
jgi:hypothetical protein